MKCNRSIVCAAALAAALLSAPRAGRADENDSRTFFAQGRKLRAAGNCNDAVTAFQRALDLWPQGIGALRNIAECEVELGHFASARNSYWSLRRAALQSNDPNYEGWDKEAEAAYDKLAIKVAKITVRVEGASADTVQVTIDGKPLDPRLIGVPLERDLGNHELALRYGGAAALTEKRTLAPGGNEVVIFKVQASPAGSAAASASVSAAPTGAASSGPEAPGFPYRGASIGSFVVGAAGLIGMGVAIGIEEGARSTIESQCHETATFWRCSPSLQPEKDKGVTAAALVNVFAVTAAVGAGAGLAFLIAAPSSRGPVKAALTLSPAPGGGMVFAVGRF